MTEFLIALVTSLGAGAASSFVVYLVTQRLRRSEPDEVEVTFQTNGSDDVRVKIRDDMGPSEIAERILAAERQATGPRAAAS